MAAEPISSIYVDNEELQHNTPYWSESYSYSVTNTGLTVIEINKAGDDVEVTWTYNGPGIFAGFSTISGATAADANLSVGESGNLGQLTNTEGIHLYSVASTSQGGGSASELTYKPSEMAAAILALPVGLDTSDANATAADILSGKTAYVNGIKVTGNIPTRTASNLSASGGTVTAPAGYYTSQVTKTISSATHANPSVSVNSSGLLTATHTQSAGYVSAGTTTGTINLTTQAAATIQPSDSAQTAVAAGRYTTGAVVLAAMSTASIPTPSISVNSATGVATATSVQTAGYVSAGTQSNTATLTVYDGSITIAGGATMIEFTIGSITYQAEDGMTWGEWVESEYNTISLEVTSGTYLGKPSSPYAYLYDSDVNNVQTTDYIISNSQYWLLSGTN